MSIEAIKLEPEKTVKPFKNIEEFLSVDLEEFFSHSFIGTTPKTVLTSPVEFLGISGSIDLSVSNNVTNRWNHSEPLGPVRLDIDFRDGLAKVKEVPLNLSLMFEMDSPDKFGLLSKYIPSFGLGSKNYFVYYHHESMGILPGDMEAKIAEWKCLPAFGSNLVKPDSYFEKRPSHVDVLLPYNLGTIRDGVEFSMVEKPQKLALAS